MDLNTLDLRTFSFSVSANADHCLQITLGSVPLGVSRFWLPLFVSTPQAAQHANMLWHFACFTDLDALFLRHTKVLLVFCKCPLHRSLPFDWLYLLFIVISIQCCSVIIQALWKHGQSASMSWVKVTARQALSCTIDCVKGHLTFS